MLDHTLSGDLLYLAKSCKKGGQFSPVKLLRCDGALHDNGTKGHNWKWANSLWTAGLLRPLPRELDLAFQNRDVFFTAFGGILFPRFLHEAAMPWHRWHLHFARNASKCLFKHTLCQCIYLCFAQMVPKKTNEKSTVLETFPQVEYRKCQAKID